MKILSLNSNEWRRKNQIKRETSFLYCFEKLFYAVCVESTLLSTQGTTGDIKTPHPYLTEESLYSYLRYLDMTVFFQ